MILIQDTREQLNLDFTGFKNVQVICTKLDAGDYSVSCYENQITFERKSVQDLVSTLIGGHERFLRELDRMKSYKEKYILIEHSPTILYQYCAKHGWEKKFNTIIQSLLAYAFHYQVKVRFCKNREDMAEYIVRKSREFINAEMSCVSSHNDTTTDSPQGV